MIPDDLQMPVKMLPPNIYYMHQLILIKWVFRNWTLNDLRMILEMFPIDYLPCVPSSMYSSMFSIFA